MSDFGANIRDIVSPINDNSINDRDFKERVERAIHLQNFLIQSAVPIPDSLFLNEFRIFEYSSRGRRPTGKEWEKLDYLVQGLFGIMDEETRRKYIAQQIPSWFIPLSITLSLLAAVVFATGVVFVTQEFSWVSSSQMILPIYMIWLMLLGILGAVASVGFNAISVSSEVTFDINNKKLLYLRLVLGGLFALFITLPFGFEGFLKFVHSINTGFIGPPSPGEESAIATQAIVLLLPFLLGYSTDLTIIILNRFLDGIKAFFGVIDKRASTIENVQPTPIAVISKPPKPDDGTRD